MTTVEDQIISVLYFAGHTFSVITTLLSSMITVIDHLFIDERGCSSIKLYINRLLGEFGPQAIVSRPLLYSTLAYQ